MPELRPEPYRALLVAEATVEREWRNALCDHLVATGCLYFLAWGCDCSIWHDCVDEAVLEKYACGHVPDENFVMTTWHENAPVEEAMWFAHHCASHPDTKLKSSYILHLATTADAQRLLTVDDKAASAALDASGRAPWEQARVSDQTRSP